MEKLMFRIRSFLISCLIVLSVNSFTAVAATMGNVYYVSKDGSDSNSGTFSAPFATINYAASLMQPGDICYIREGVYYETLSTNMHGTKENPISFCAYNDETVILSGGALLSNWTKHSGNIYVTDMNWDIYYGTGNMIFADDELCLEARWPNATVADLLNRNTYAKVDSANGLTVSDSDLPNFDLTGAQMWIANGPSYWSTIVNIDAHDMSRKTLTVNNAFSSATYYPQAENIYYIMRDYDLLDSPGEWYKDTANGKLYFYAPDNTNVNTMKIEAKKREYAIYLNDSSYVNFSGINVRNGLISFSENTNHCRFSDSVIESLDYRMRSGVQPSAKGVVIGGHHNRLSGCEIKNMFGEGVTLQGNNNYVNNNYIHHINFEHTYSDGVYITGSNHLINHNTITATGRSTIGGKFEGCVISYNDLSDSCRISKDGGTLYFNAHDYRNSEIHHNIIHDAMNNEGLQYGLYLDSFTTSMIVYNNLIYGMEPEDTSGSKRLTLCLNPNSLNNLFINNTFVNTRPANTHAGSTYDLSGCVFINNLFRSQAHALSEDTFAAMDVLFKNNLEGSVEQFADYWSDSANGDYTLASDSAALDAGIPVAGITDGYLGNAPDCGAFEYGKEPWTAGHDFSVEGNPEFGLNDKIPYANRVQNPGFESGLAGWDGNAEVLESDSWSMWGKFSKDGEKALEMSDGDTLSTTVTGLKPFTAYKFGGYGFLGGTFVRANEYTKAYNSTYQDCGRFSESFPLNNLGNIKILEYQVDFGDKQYDKLVFGVRYHKKGQKISFRKGSLSVSSIAEIYETSNYSSVGWKWYELDLRETLTGQTTLYISLESGDFSSTTIAGFYPYSSTAGDNILINAVSDNQTEKNIAISSASFDKPMPSDYITTGAKGEITVQISKNGDAMYGYVDYITVCEKPEALSDAGEGVTLIGAAARDITGTVYENNQFSAGNFNMFEISFWNHTEKAIPVTGILLFYDENSRFVGISTINSTIQSEKKTNLLLGKQIDENIREIKFLLWKTEQAMKPLTAASTFYRSETQQK